MCVEKSRESVIKGNILERMERDGWVLPRARVRIQTELERLKVITEDLSESKTLK